MSCINFNFIKILSVTVFIVFLASPSFAVTDEVDTFDGAAAPCCGTTDLSGWLFSWWGGGSAVVPPATAAVDGLGSLALVTSSTHAVQLFRSIGPGDMSMEITFLPEARIPEPQFVDAGQGGDYWDVNIGHQASLNRLLVGAQINAGATGYRLVSTAVHTADWSQPAPPVEIGIPSEVRLMWNWDDTAGTYDVWYGLDGSPPNIPLVTGEAYDPPANSRFIEIRGTAGTNWFINGSTESLTTLMSDYSLSSILQQPEPTFTPTPAGPTATPTPIPPFTGLGNWDDFR